MAAIPSSKIELFAYGYTRNHIIYPHRDIIQCLIRSFNGDEGIPSIEDELEDDNDTSIAKEHKVEHSSIQQLDDIIRGIPQYFVAQNPIPTRQQFCVEMKNRHIIRKGAAIKVYKYICRVGAQPEGAIVGSYQLVSSLKYDSVPNSELKANTLKHSEAIRGDIFIGKQLIKKLGGLIEEKFYNELVLYCYIDISTSLQRNDDQIAVFTVLMNDKEIKLSVINYDLHCQDTKNVLYGIITSNDNDDMKENECLWKLSEYMTGNAIFDKFGIKSSELPRSSCGMIQFLKRLHIEPMINCEIINLVDIDNTNWSYIKQIGLSTKSVTLNEEIWIKECKKSFTNTNSILIPIVVNERKNHWIEWVKIICIKSQNIYVGISCKYNNFHKKWCVESIYLDRNAIYKKHRLIGFECDYWQNIPPFSLNKLKFTKDD